MKRIRITVIRKACYRDLMERYENPLEHPCDLSEGQCFECDGGSRPEGLCESAWQSLSPFVMALAHGATGLYDGWMKNPASAMLSCNDGFRPVSFLVEALDEPAPDGQASNSGEPARKEPADPTPGSGEPAARKEPADPTPGSGEPARKEPADPTPGSGEPARKEPADPTPGSGEPAARKEPADPTPGNEMPAGKEPDRPETRPGNASATDTAPAAAPSAPDAARHRGKPAAATAATAASPAAAPAAAPANPETRPYEKTES